MPAATRRKRREEAYLEAFLMADTDGDHTLGPDELARLLNEEEACLHQHQHRRRHHHHRHRHTRRQARITKAVALHILKDLTAISTHVTSPRGDVQELGLDDFLRAVRSGAMDAAIARHRPPAPPPHKRDGRHHQHTQHPRKSEQRRTDTAGVSETYPTGKVDEMVLVSAGAKNNVPSSCVISVPGNNDTTEAPPAHADAILRLILRRKMFASSFALATQVLCLAHAPVSRRVFLYYLCENVAGRHFLRADYSIECGYAYAVGDGAQPDSAGQWEQFHPAVLFVLLVFTIGFPLGLIGVLSKQAYQLKCRKKHVPRPRCCKHRKSRLRVAPAGSGSDDSKHQHAAKQRKKKRREGDGGNSNKNAAGPGALYQRGFYSRMGFLYEPYRRGTEWWEVHEMTRKLLLTGLLLFTSERSTIRALSSVFVCVGMSISLNYFRPHRSAIVFWIAQLANFACTCKYLVAVVIAANTEGMIVSSGGGGGGSCGNQGGPDAIDGARTEKWAMVAQDTERQAMGYLLLVVDVVVFVVSICASCACLWKLRRKAKMLASASSLPRHDTNSSTVEKVVSTNTKRKASNKVVVNSKHGVFRTGHPATASRGVLTHSRSRRHGSWSSGVSVLSGRNVLEQLDDRSLATVRISQLTAAYAVQQQQQQQQRRQQQRRQHRMSRVVTKSIHSELCNDLIDHCTQARAVHSRQIIARRERSQRRLRERLAERKRIAAQVKMQIVARLSGRLSQLRDTTAATTATAADSSTEFSTVQYSEFSTVHRSHPKKQLAVLEATRRRLGRAFVSRAKFAARVFPTAARPGKRGKPAVLTPRGMARLVGAVTKDASKLKAAVRDAGLTENMLHSACFKACWSLHGTRNHNSNDSSSTQKHGLLVEEIQEWIWPTMSRESPNVSPSTRKDHTQEEEKEK